MTYHGFPMLFLVTISSCNSEELFVEEQTIVYEDTEDVVEEDNTEDDTTEEETEVDASLPCEFTLNNVEANSTIIIKDSIKKN